MSGLDIAAHDLGRSFAKLSFQGGCMLDQLQLSLGHASIVTTQRYLGSQQSFTTAPCDFIAM